MEDKSKKSNINKLYFEGDWKKQDDIIWAFFDDKDTSEEEKKPEKIEEPLPEEKEEEDSDINREVVSITDLGRSKYDPRYASTQEVEKATAKQQEQEKIIGKQQEQEKKEKEIIPSQPQLQKQKQSQTFAELMHRSKQKLAEDARKKENLLKIRSVIHELGIYGFSFFSMMFEKDANISNANFKKMGDILKYDPALSLKILQIANSAYYGLSKKTFNIKNSLNILGIERVRQILDKAAQSPLFKSIKKRTLFKQLWYHSLGAGVFCRFLSKDNDMNTDEMFMMGMLHDLGKVILYIALPGQYENIITIIKETPVLIRELEKEIIGLDHCEAGAMALEAWELPEQLINSAKYHHNLDLIQNPQILKQLAIVQAGDILCNLSNIGNMGAKRTQLFDKKIKLVLKKIEPQKLMEMARKEIKDIENLLASEC